METGTVIDRDLTRRVRRSIGMGLVVVATVLSIHGAPETNGNPEANGAHDVQQDAADLESSDLIDSADDSAGAQLPSRPGTPTPRVEYGSVREVIVDHPGVADTRGRFLALAVRHEPKGGADHADLVHLGQSNLDSAPGRGGSTRLVPVTDDASETGVTGSLEVSLDAAWIAANRLAGHDVEFDRYVAITNAEDESVLRTGDRVLLLDGSPVGRGLFMAFAGDPERDSWFTVIRGNSRLSIRTADVDLADVEILEAARTTAERPAMVVRSSTRGPSAGVVSALAYLDAITSGDLTAGLTIAGTGTVTPHGYVGDVIGATSKAAAAAEAGADVLFVPHDNQEEAILGAPHSLEIVPIHSVEDALKWLTARR